ncbi:ABC transporter permease [Lachnoclostridium sp. Marseille-P6806]|uniref:ABC transporter permease n=1 Tax=Lachnoclostridium sp. Marseille-P6806 TaxID=2364793 RepID=UPI001030E6A8|nr:ABC transporter permease subunit [Lachnoclostridium sp. Marseille-P6806]
MKAAEKRGRGAVRRDRVLLMMILPAILYYIIFSYLPMAGTVLAFKNYNYVDGIFGSPWNGLKNFRFLFSGGKIFRVAWNTLAFNTVFIVVNQSLQILTAVFLTEIGSRYFKKISQSVIFLPYFISWVIVGGFIYNLFNYEYGSLNTLLRTLGADPVDMYSDVGAWKYVLVLVNAWKWVGYGSVIYLAAITGIDREIYEAASIEGAGKFRQIFSLTIPLIVPQIVTLVLLDVGRIFKGDFEMFYQVTGNNPLLYETTDVIDTFVVRSLLQLQDVGMSSAAGLMQSLINFAILMIVNAAVKRAESDYALF